MELDTMKQMVIEASTTFYSTKDKDTRRSAEEWLNNFKKSVHAWYITDQILHTDKNEQVLFFAAQTIRSKIQYNFHELPVDSHEVSFTHSVPNIQMQHQPRPNRSTPTLASTSSFHDNMDGGLAVVALPFNLTSNVSCVLCAFIDCNRGHN